MIDNREKNFVSAVIYVHDASNRIEAFVKAVVKSLSENFEHSEVICVNDASSDNSADIIKSAVKELAAETSVSILNMSFFHGIEPAMNAGKDLAIGDFVFEFDSSVLDFDPKLIMDVYRKSLEGFDIVSAVPKFRASAGTRTFYRLLNRFGNYTYKFCTERFRIISRRAINRISSMNREIVYRKAVYAGCGLKSANIQYVPDKTAKLEKNSEEKYYKKELAINSLLIFTEVGYKISMFITFLMGLISLGMVVYSLVIYFLKEPVAGWTSTILFISVIFFGLFVILTMIIRYLQLLVGLSFKRGSFTFESIDKITNVL